MTSALRFTLASLVCATAAVLRAAAPAANFNVVILMTDEHNPRVLGCAGDPLVQTPTLDHLAATGVRFSAAYCQNPVCTPSRVALVSGRMPSNLKIFGNNAAATTKYKGITTLADLFVQAGYETVWFGKQHWGDPRFQNTRGVDRADFEKAEKEFGRLPQESRVSTWPIEQNTDHATAEEALAFLEKNRGQKKFFMGVSLIKPHFPFTIQAKYYDLYKDRIGMPRATDQMIAELPQLSQQERANYNHAAATREDILRSRAMYYGMVTYADEELGRVVKKLEQLGLRDNTIILYTSDHGEMAGERGLWYKNTFYEGGAGIPFIWSSPKLLPHGKVVRTPAMNMDVLPTLAEFCGLPKPEGLEGSSLLPVLTGANDGASRYALSESYRGNFAGRMIRTDRWKYFFYTTGEEYLYDEVNDPYEETNLVKAPEHRALAAELKQRASANWTNRQRNIREIVAGDAQDAGAAPQKPNRRKKDK